MNQAASILISKTVTINGSTCTSVLSANCKPEEVAETTLQMLEKMTQAIPLKQPPRP